MGIRNRLFFFFSGGDGAKLSSKSLQKIIGISAVFVCITYLGTDRFTTRTNSEFCILLFWGIGSMDRFDRWLEHYRMYGRIEWTVSDWQHQSMYRKLRFGLTDYLLMPDCIYGVIDCFVGFFFSVFFWNYLKREYAHNLVFDLIDRW